jgi:PadR family transcriptional regulator, regulatory protein PadR
VEATLELLKGTLDAMVLKTLSGIPMHGYGVTRWIREQSGGALEVDDAAMYQALHRLEGRGWAEAEWGLSENNRKAKYYTLTERGREQLGLEVRGIRSYVRALLQVLEAEPAKGV